MRRESPVPDAYTDKIDIMESVAGIESGPEGQRFKGWIDLGLRKPASFVQVLQTNSSTMSLTRGQQKALRMLSRASLKEPNEERREALAKGGLTALQSLAGSELKLEDVGRATGALVKGSKALPPTLRRGYLEAGLDAIYTRTLGDASYAMKLELPLKQSAEDPVFLGKLLRLDPKFEGFGSRSRGVNSQSDSEPYPQSTAPRQNTGSLSLGPSEAAALGASLGFVSLASLLPNPLAGFFVGSTSLLSRSWAEGLLSGQSQTVAIDPMDQMTGSGLIADNFRFQGFFA
ncbi:MAG: hypothetical protein KC800_05335 [Candidatus Eremiobacteraeota bacterium]|nr:hypothetical protein [Candidatus Eremiobacteraeota bacterium]